MVGLVPVVFAVIFLAFLRCADSASNPTSANPLIIAAEDRVVGSAIRFSFSHDAEIFDSAALVHQIDSVRF